MTPARLCAVILVGLVASTQSTSAKGPRQHGDPLLVGEVVRIRLLVTEDYYFGVVACGQFQCGGIRVDGVDWQGMGFRTFLSNATNNPYRARWVEKEDNKFGTAFVPGHWYTFVVSRPVEQEMRLWIEDKERRFASVKLERGSAPLYIAFRNGDIRFVGDPSNVKTPGSKRHSMCTGTKETFIVKDGTDILEIKAGCRYESDDKVRVMCVIYLAAEGVKGKQEVYRSTFTRDEYDPEQEETLMLPFRFEENQYLFLEVYKGYSDCETPEHDFLGLSKKTPLADVITQRKVEVPLALGVNSVRFSARFQRNCDERVTFQFSGRGIGGEGNIFMEILKGPAKAGLDYEEVSQSNKARGKYTIRMGKWKRSRSFFGQSLSLTERVFRSTKIHWASHC